MATIVPVPGGLVSPDLDRPAQLIDRRSKIVCMATHISR
jgi:hypothetical protein